MPNVSRSEKLFERAKKFIPGGVSSEDRGPSRGILPGIYPMYIERASGSHIYDVDGNEYIDYLMAFGPVILGHSHPKVNEAVKKQLEKGSIFGLNHELEQRVAEMIVEGVPCADQVLFSNTGSEATSIVVRIARAYTGNEKIAKFDLGYHGWHDWSSVIATGGLENNYLKSFKTPGIPKSLMQDIIILPWNNVGVVEKLIKRHAHELAAVICEPCPRVPPEEGFLKVLRDTTEDHDVLLIFDEVKTGFRLAFGGAQEYFGVTPDLATFAKALGNGFPISAVAGKKIVLEAVANYEVPFLGTYSSNPISLAAALATLTELKARNGKSYKQLFDIGGKLRKGLGDAIEDVGIEAIVQGPEPMQWLLFTDLEKITNFREAQSINEYQHRKRRFIFSQELLKKEVLCHPDPANLWHVSLAHTEEDVNNTIRAAEEALKETKRNC